MARQEHDFYPTPQELCDAVCKRLAEILPVPTVIAEPSAGSGNFVRACRKTWQAPVYAYDIRPECSTECLGAGAVTFSVSDWYLFMKSLTGPLPDGTLVVGNPPFFQAQKHITATLERMGKSTHLAFLLKANFLGGTARAKKLWVLPGFRYYIPIAGRPSFVQTEKATNGFEEYGIYVWEGGYTGRPEILFPHIFWR
jgi:hypothetical protein